MTTANIMLWGQRVGAAAWDRGRQVAVFRYAPEFVAAGIQVAPLTMPLGDAPYLFPQLDQSTYRGLPGLLADSLPDRFGNRLIDAWLAERGMAQDAFSPVDRLCYIGRRGMGALEFEPALGQDPGPLQVDVGELVGLANRALHKRAALSGAQLDRPGLEKILRVGISPGGARARACVEQVSAAVMEWPACAAQAGVGEGTAERIQQALRLDLAR